jgi:hypothetical protein
MAKYYTKEKDRIVIRPLAFLLPIGIAFLVLLLLLPLMTILIMVKGQVQEMEAKNFASYILLLPLIIASIPLFTYSRRQVVFEKNEKMVYLRTIFGRKALMAFEEMGDITLKATFGMAYYLKSKADRYGQGYRISPSFINVKDPSKKEFEEVLLPEIREIRALQPVAPLISDPAKILLQTGMLNFYNTHADGYVLKPNGVWASIPSFVLFLIFAGIGWYSVIFGKGWPEKDQFIAFIPFIPLGFFLATVSRRVVFDVKRKSVRLYLFGLPLISHPLSGFSGFNIVRKTHNGIYNGTDIRMKFVKEGSKTEQELTLKSFGKTNPIEPFLDETEFVLSSYNSSSF